MSILKIAITGPESSGKSKLAEDISVYYDALMVPEYARTFLEEYGPEYTRDQFLEMANEQHGQMEFYESLAQEMIIYDTEMLVYKIWGSEKYNQDFEVIDRVWGQQDFPLYLLCKPDIAWEEDRLRENQGNRDALFIRYQTELMMLKRPYVIIDGQGDVRFEKAKVEIEKLLIKS